MPFDKELDHFIKDPAETFRIAVNFETLLAVYQVLDPAAELSSCTLSARDSDTGDDTTDDVLDDTTGTINGDLAISPFFIAGANGEVHIIQFLATLTNGEILKESIQMMVEAK